MDSSPPGLDQLISNKTEELLKLNQEHEKLLMSKKCIPNLEIEALNAELYSLIAEYKYLKESEPETMPKSDAFLYGWARHSLEEDIKQKEEILSNLDKMHEESKKKKSLINRRPNMTYENVNKKMLEDARSKNEQLHCLHRKMVRRLRRLSRRFSTLPSKSGKMNSSTRDTSGNVLKRSFYRVLKKSLKMMTHLNGLVENWNSGKILSP
ncbi:unnamed protein product [Larinioides sclopetarius]|uniref:Uncharacterized protein n=1 Tax=Larinioides sclopetarius TaxID=280406 RepID=A0AAV2BBN2_9ARAC